MFRPGRSRAGGRHRAAARGPPRRSSRRRVRPRPSGLPSRRFTRVGHPGDGRTRAPQDLGVISSPVRRADSPSRARPVCTGRAGTCPGRRTRWGTTDMPGVPSASGIRSNLSARRTSGAHTAYRRRTTHTGARRHGSTPTRLYTRHGPRPNGWPYAGYADTPKARPVRRARRRAGRPPPRRGAPVRVGIRSGPPRAWRSRRARASRGSGRPRRSSRTAPSPVPA